MPTSRRQPLGQGRRRRRRHYIVGNWELEGNIDNVLLATGAWKATSPISGCYSYVEASMIPFVSEFACWRSHVSSLLFLTFTKPHMSVFVHEVLTVSASRHSHVATCTLATMHWYSTEFKALHSPVSTDKFPLTRRR